ncbi:hypothetical protein GCM10022253_16150 [Sphingomonas endophytica]|uniref:Flagellar protein FliL n=1 Tax=Sphingomonas endophytica TaxID=869719 RepID=A0A7X0MNP3_9SPHN|nr:hypothetical protein [Sphingomonas endophytica]MBB5725657.1 hypothetical protein [Sphingomonas endophytica]MBB6505381.1 hypothetical protein [Sphingomonas endophytica]
MSLALLLTLALAAAPAADERDFRRNEGGVDTAMTGSDARYVWLDEIVLPIFGESQMEGKVHVRLVLDAGDKAGAAAVHARLPRLRARALSALLEFARLNASPYAALDARALSVSLNRALRAEDRQIARVLIARVRVDDG